MENFEYVVSDTSGRKIAGSQIADNPNDLIQRLSQQGYRVHSVKKAPTSPVRASNAPPPAKVSAAIQPAVRKSQRPAEPINTLSVNPAQASLYFFGLANLLKSGISPHQAMNQLATRRQVPALSEASKLIAQWTAEGGSMADAMAVFPNLFTPGMVGAVRAGEKGGYTWEACELIAEEQAAAKKFRRFFWWVPWGILQTFLAFWLFTLLRGAMEGGIDSINGKGETNQLMMEYTMRLAVSPIGIMFFCLGLVGLASVFYFKHPSSRMFQSRMAINFPVLGKRTKSENLAHFCWHLGQLGKAGITPWTSWQLAAKAVPNEAFSERLLESSGQMGEGIKLSDLAYRTRVIPQEFGNILETGEMAGAIPAAMEQASEYGMEMAKSAETMLKVQTGIWMAILVFGGGAIAFVIFYSSYLYGAFRVLEN